MWLICRMDWAIRYLLFQTSGLELSMSLNGEEIYFSAAVLPERLRQLHIDQALRLNIQ